MSDATATTRKHLINIAEWRKLGDANIFRPDSRLELLGGEIFELALIGPNHASRVKRLIKLFSSLIADRAIVAVQDPVQLGEFSEPQPDLMLLRPAVDFYERKHPAPADVFLLVEVADNSIEFDRNQKLALYAAHGIPEYWLLNLNNQCLEVYRDPHGQSYANKSVLLRGGSVSLLQLTDITIELNDIL